MAQVSKMRTLGEKDMKSYLDRMENHMIEELRHGDIFKVFVNSKFKISDFQDFFADQWKMWKGNVIQDEQIMASYSSFHEPNINHFPIHSRSNILTSEERSELAAGFERQMTGGGKLSSSRVVKSGESREADVEGEEQKKQHGPMDNAELEEAARGAMSDWDSFLSDMWIDILDNQMITDYRSKMDEVEKEAQRIITLAKQGAIGAEFVLVALAKVNATKNGVLLSWVGKKAFGVNESINRVADDLNKVDPSSSNYVGQLQYAQNRTRDKSFQLNLLTQDMQKITQDMASVMDQCKSMMDEINRVKREIVSKIGLRS